jgi:tRNA G18 (ribose-2'-O)-methylase SpoU
MNVRQPEPTAAESTAAESTAAESTAAELTTSVRVVHEVRECTAAHCRLRFPARSDELPTHTCPACGAPTVTAATVHVGGEMQVTPPGPAAPLAVLVDNVRSIFNVGSIFRSADGAGVHHLYLCGITPTPAHRKLAKTALGAEQTVAWSYHRNSLGCAETLRQQGYALWALEEDTRAVSVFSAPLPAGPLALIVGNEVTGIDPALVAAADQVVALPMYGTKRSLNVATALGAAVILLAHRYRGDQPTYQPSAPPSTCSGRVL